MTARKNAFSLCHLAMSKISKPWQKVGRLGPQDDRSAVLTKIVTARVSSIVRLITAIKELGELSSTGQNGWLQS
jgi:hypothetical protein